MGAKCDRHGSRRDRHGSRRLRQRSRIFAMRAEGMIDMNAEGIRVAMDRHESKKDRLDS